MDTRFLQTLLAVVETGSLTRTAQALNITPSAVMQRIRVLEGEVGAPLVIRSGQAMMATAVCSAILADAKLVVSVASDIRSAASGRFETGQVRVGVIHTVLTGLMPDVMVALAAEKPGVELYIVPGASIDLYGKLVEGALDAAILIRPSFALTKTLEWTPLREEPLKLLMPHWFTDDDPLAVLRREPFIRYDRNHWGGRLVDQYLRANRIVPREAHELDSLDAISILVDRGLGVALLPDWLPPWPAGVNLRRLDVPDAPSRVIGLIRPKASRRQPLIDALAEQVVTVARKHLSAEVRQTM